MKFMLPLSSRGLLRRCLCVVGLIILSLQVSSHDVAAHRIARRASLRGKVTIGGRIVPRAARVLVLRPGSKTPVTEPATVRADGSYRIDELEPGSYTLKAVDKSHPPAERSKCEIADGDNNIVNFELKEPKKKTTFRGRVRGVAGSAADMLRVILYSPEGVELEVARLDENGVFNIEDVAAEQTYQLAIGSDERNGSRKMGGIGGLVGRIIGTNPNNRLRDYYPISDVATLAVNEETEMQLELELGARDGARRTLTVRNAPLESPPAQERNEELAGIGAIIERDVVDISRDRRVPAKEPKVVDKKDSAEGHREEARREERHSGSGGVRTTRKSSKSSRGRAASRAAASTSGGRSGIELSFPSAIPEAEAGGRLRIPLVITNRSTIADSFMLEVDLPSSYQPSFLLRHPDGKETSGHVAITPPLEPLQSLTVFLILSVPETSVAAEELRLLVRASSTTDRYVSVIESTKVVFDPAALSVATVASHASVQPGETVTQSVTVRNPSRRPVLGVRADFIVSPGFEFVNAEPTAVTYDVAARAVVWSLGDMDAGAERVLKVTLRVLPDATADDRAQRPLGRGLLRSGSLPVAVIFAGANVLVKPRQD
ncbi:MAG TPA: carboxypeptidase regulatory-like domain-containing protein [Pyrinomonadaceae bacterium]|jgi:uncharacterized repeat protein (TIGR01451 family)